MVAQIPYQLIVSNLPISNPPLRPPTNCLPPTLPPHTVSILIPSQLPQLLAVADEFTGPSICRNSFPHSVTEGGVMWRNLNSDL